MNGRDAEPFTPARVRVGRRIALSPAAHHNCTTAIRLDIRTVRPTPGSPREDDDPLRYLSRCARWSRWRCSGRLSECWAARR